MSAPLNETIEESADRLGIPLSASQRANYGHMTWPQLLDAWNQIAPQIIAAWNHITETYPLLAALAAVRAERDAGTPGD